MLLLGVSLSQVLDLTSWINIFMFQVAYNARTGNFPLSLHRSSTDPWPSILKQSKTVSVDIRKIGELKGM